jgi:hypothetical protein
MIHFGESKNIAKGHRLFIVFCYPNKKGGLDPFRGGGTSGHQHEVEHESDEIS